MDSIFRLPPLDKMQNEQMLMQMKVQMCVQYWARNDKVREKQS